MEPAKRAHHGCRFCAIAAGVAFTPYDRPILESDRYLAVASLGGFLPGWTLIIPRDHELNLSQRYADPAFLDFAAEVQRAVSTTFGNTVMFEHGANHAGSSTGCGTDHAHMHLVPLEASLTALATSYGTPDPWQRYPISELHRVAGAEYLFVSDQFEHAKTSGLLQLLRAPRSQFFRRVIAEHLGMPGLADYRQEPLESLATSTATRLRDVLNQSLKTAA
jgi:ATP adenylyltransferase